jgi:hypothetical protein
MAKAANDITIPELMQGLAHGDPGARVRRLSGFRKLATIVRAEFSADLDWRTLGLLRGLLCTSLMMGTDPVDDLRLGDAARILEAEARRLPSGRLIDGRRADCVNCGRPLSIEERAWQQGWCDDCRKPEDKVVSLDTAIRTESRDYNEYGRDPLDRFPEWHAISNVICKRYNRFKVERDHWERFLNECESELGIGRERLLGMRRADLMARVVRPAKPPPAANRSTPLTEGEPAAAGKGGEDRPEAGNAAAVALTEETPLEKALHILKGSSKAMGLVKYLYEQTGWKATLREVTRHLYIKAKVREPTAGHYKAARQLIRRTAKTLARLMAPLRMEYDWDRDEIRLVDVAAKPGPATL